jgi:hypothetical protein
MRDEEYFHASARSIRLAHEDFLDAPSELGDFRALRGHQFGQQTRREEYAAEHEAHLHQRE